MVGFSNKKEFQRSERLSEVIQMELAQLIAREISDPRLKDVTISAVKVTPDLGHSKVYFSMLHPDEKQVQAALDAFKSATGFIRKYIAKNTKLRKTPSFTFYYDDTDDYGRRVTSLIDSIQ